MQSYFWLFNVTSRVASPFLDVLHCHVWLIRHNLINFISFSNQIPLSLLTGCHTGYINKRLSYYTGQFQVQRQCFLSNLQCGYNIIQGILEKVLKFSSSIVPEFIDSVSRNIYLFLSKELKVDSL